jgi:hypothetical protein
MSICERSHDPEVGIAMLLVRTEASAKLHEMEISVGNARIHPLRHMMGVRRIKHYNG